MPTTPNATVAPTAPRDGTKQIRIAVAQSVAGNDPGDRAALHATGDALRALVRDSAAAGARLVHLPEGALCAPGKELMSSTGPDDVGPSDWSRCAWDALRDELHAIAALAAELRIWVVVGSVHQLTEPHRPHNSLYVIDDQGAVVTRYDERLLSNTKLRFMYTPGSAPVTFAVDGVRFGCTMGMEVHFPELFLAYEQLDVDCVLFSTIGGPADQLGVFAAEARAHAATNSYWVSYAVTAQDAVHAPAGVVSPQGAWVGRGPQRLEPALVVVDVDDSEENLARPWRRVVRAGVHDEHIVRDDPRSEDRLGF
jgi:predicted amidohydrolase